MLPWSACCDECMSLKLWRSPMPWSRLCHMNWNSWFPWMTCCCAWANLSGFVYEEHSSCTSIFWACQPRWIRLRLRGSWISSYRVEQSLFETVESTQHVLSLRTAMRQRLRLCPLASSDLKTFFEVQDQVNRPELTHFKFKDL